MSEATETKPAITEEEVLAAKRAAEEADEPFLDPRAGPAVRAAFNWAQESINVFNSHTDEEWANCREHLTQQHVDLAEEFLKMVMELEHLGFFEEAEQRLREAGIEL